MILTISISLGMLKGSFFPICINLSKASECGFQQGLPLVLYPGKGIYTCSVLRQESCISDAEPSVADQVSLEKEHLFHGPSQSPWPQGRDFLEPPVSLCCDIIAQRLVPTWLWEAPRGCRDDTPTLSHVGLSLTSG